MHTFLVWILIVGFYENSHGQQHTVVIDNIASRRNCEAVAKVVVSTHADVQASPVCIQVRKVAP